ncbi:hypothetical protein PHET_08251 [Paragonimus heterotremus]|uniref:Uncharacterized protein n=1 Tax=Paragonimus heterotremus TaxID=100268 RepID=A0A8J4WFW4_9TREM|nr:hypothetical protein PHET_08251 [Paragonimus heterotremus]
MNCCRKYQNILTKTKPFKDCQHIFTICSAANLENHYIIYTILLHLLSPKSATDRATQVGCDFAYTNKTVVPAIYILCFYNYP